jgi:hypothetical protein
MATVLSAHRAKSHEELHTINASRQNLGKTLSAAAYRHSKIAIATDRLTGIPRRHHNFRTAILAHCPKSAYFLIRLKKIKIETKCRLTPMFARR